MIDANLGNKRLVTTFEQFAKFLKIRSGIRRLASLKREHAEQH